MNPVDLRNYVSTKSCCLSTKGLSLLDTMRGGQTSPCCMTKHVLAREVSDLMANAYVQDTWQKVTLNLTGKYNPTPPYASAMVWNYWTATNSLGEVIEHGRVPNNQAGYTLPTALNASGMGFQLGQQLVELFNQGSSDPLNIQISAVNTTPASPAQDEFTITVVLYLNENYINLDGSFSSTGWALVSSHFDFSLVGGITLDQASKEETTELLYNCLTSANMCELGSYLDSYCDSCGEYVPDTVT